MKKMIKVDEAWVDPEHIMAVVPVLDGGCIIMIDNDTVECPVATPDDVMQAIQEVTE